MEAERDDRPAPPAHATGAVEFVALDDLAPDETFRVCGDGDVAALATSMGRLGQLAPIEVRPALEAGGDPCGRWQVVAGFRRLAAVRLLARDRVLARIHRDLSDHDAWALALAEALLHEPLASSELNALEERLRGSGVAPWAEELIEDALVRAPVEPELRERFHEFLTAPPAILHPVGVAEPMADEPPPSPDVAPEPETALPRGDGSDSPAEDVVEVTPEELVNDVTSRLYALNEDLATACEAWEQLPADGRRALVDQVRYLASLLPVMEARE